MQVMQLLCINLKCLHTLTPIKPALLAMFPALLQVQFSTASAPEENVVSMVMNFVNSFVIALFCFRAQDFHQVKAHFLKN